MKENNAKVQSYVLFNGVLTDLGSGLSMDLYLRDLFRTDSGLFSEFGPVLDQFPPSVVVSEFG